MQNSVSPGESDGHRFLHLFRRGNRTYWEEFAAQCRCYAVDQFKSHRAVHVESCCTFHERAARSRRKVALWRLSVDRVVHTGVKGAQATECKHKITRSSCQRVRLGLCYGCRNRTPIVRIRQITGQQRACVSRCTQELSEASVWTIGRKYRRVEKICQVVDSFVDTLAHGLDTEVNKNSETRAGNANTKSQCAHKYVHNKLMRTPTCLKNTII